MRKLSDTQIDEGRWIAAHGWFAVIPARTAAAMQRNGYIIDTRASDSGPVWRFTLEGLYAWAKQAGPWMVAQINHTYIEDAEAAAYLEDLERTYMRKANDGVLRGGTIAHDASALAGRGEFQAAIDLLDGAAPTLNDFEYDELAAEMYPVTEQAHGVFMADAELEAKVAERRAAAGATVEQRTEIVRLAANRRVPAGSVLEAVVTAATSTDAPLSYERAQDAIGALLRAPRPFNISTTVDVYKRQTGRSTLTPKQARRLKKKLARDLV